MNSYSRVQMCPYLCVHASVCVCGAGVRVCPYVCVHASEFACALFLPHVCFFNAPIRIRIINAKTKTSVFTRHFNQKKNHWVWDSGERKCQYSLAFDICIFIYIVCTSQAREREFKKPPAPSRMFGKCPACCSILHGVLQWVQRCVAVWV